MKKFGQAFCLLFFCQAFSVFASSLVILHTNDLHSKFEGDGPDSLVTPQVGDGDPVRGHYARVAARLKELRGELGPDDQVMLVDAGDFYSGSLFHMLGPKKEVAVFPEWQFFVDQDYDAIALGNHEFDAGEDSFFQMLAKVKSDDSTQLIVSNVKEESMEFFAPYSFVKQVGIFKKGQYNVGVIGLTGPDAALVSVGLRKNVSFYGHNDAKGRMNWGEYASRVKAVVAELRPKVDFLMVVMHGGTPEDTKLAKQVSGIDLIIAGHTHEAYPQVKKVGDTYISQAGCYGGYIGRLEFSTSEKPFKRIEGKHLHAIDDNTEMDKVTLEKIENYKTQISQFLKPQNLRYDSKIKPIGKSYSLGEEWGKETMSRIRDEINKNTEGDPLDLYYSSLGLIRKGLPNGSAAYQLSDIFKIFSIGFDENKEIGSPIYSFYLLGSDVKKLINLMDFYAGFFSKSFAPAFPKDLTYDRKWWGIPLINKIDNLKIKGEPMDMKKLYHIGTNGFVASYLGRINSMSYGFFDLTIRDEKGAVLEQLKPIDHKE